MERLPPPRANQRLNHLWKQASKRVLKLAVLQEGAGLMDTQLMDPWKAGTLGKAITAIYTHYDAQFTAMTCRKHQAGLDIRRIHILDDNPSPEGQAYLGLLIEYFRRINVPLGQENIYLLPRGECDRQRVVLPSTDIALFDDHTAVVTHYTETCISHRDIYTASQKEDAPYVQKTLRLAQRLTDLLSPAHLLQGAGTDEQLTWIERHRREWLPQ